MGYTGYVLWGIQVRIYNNRGNFGGRTELTEVSVAGIAAIPNTPVCFGKRRYVIYRVGSPGILWYVISLENSICS